MNVSVIVPIYFILYWGIPLYLILDSPHYLLCRIPHFFYNPIIPFPLEIQSNYRYDLELPKISFFTYVIYILIQNKRNEDGKKTTINY